MAFKRKIYKGAFEGTDEFFVCDSASDISALPANAEQGSRAFVIEDSTLWMSGSDGQWTEVDSGGGGGSGITLTTLNTSANGTYNAPSGTAYKKVVSNVEGGVPANPTDGKTHIWIRIDEDTPEARMTFPLLWTQTVSNGVTVNWGDGTAAQTFDGTTELETHTHTYARGGEYEITLDVTDGKILFGGTNGTTGTGIYGSKSNAYSYNRTRIQRVFFGDNVDDIGAYTLQYCYGLKYANIPDNISSIKNGVFQNCYSLVKVDMPEHLLDIGASAFYYCFSMQSIDIPSGLVEIGDGAFNSCYSLKSIDIPSTLGVLGAGSFRGCHNLQSINISSYIGLLWTSEFDSCYGLTSITVPRGVSGIGSSTFANCYSVKEYHMQRTTPPTLDAVSAFTGMASDCVIYVPYSEDHSVLNAYKSATNWATYASKMQEEAQP